MRPLRAVLFDVGGPLDLELEHERLIDLHIREAFAAAGRVISDDAYAAAERAAVVSFAPNAYRALIWTLSGHDAALARAVFATLDERSAERERLRGGLELRPGIGELFARLAGRGLVLGVVANQPRAVLAELERHGLLRWLTYREVSGTHGFRKPDPRAFLHACEALEVAPAEAILVGDRIDNDIAPARALGMTAIRFVTGRHAGQQPRAWDEVPDAEVTSVAELEAAIEAAYGKRTRS